MEPSTKRLLGRVLVGALLIAAMGLVLLLDAHLQRAWRAEPGGGTVLVGLPLAALTALLIVAACGELGALAAAAGAPIPRLTCTVGAIAVGTMPFWLQAAPRAAAHGAAAGAVLLAGVLLGLFVEQMVRRGPSGAVRRLAGAALAVCYLGVCAAVILAIRLRFGVRALVLFLAAVKFTDIGAYFAGTFLGRHKLVPSISAGKTWEGLGGGLALAVVCGVLIGGRGLLGEGLMATWAAGVFGLVVGLFGQAADLCESTLKRDAGAKDSGASVPHFGGVLDVLDSPLLAAPVGYVLLAVFCE